MKISNQRIAMKEMKIKETIFAVCAAFLICSCAEDEIKPYQGDQYIYFSQLMDKEETEVSESFNNYPTSNEITVKIGLALIGNPFEQAAPYKVIVVDTATTAQAKNYALPVTTEFKAGVAKDTLELKLIKTDDLKENVKLCLQLMPNEYFGGSMKQYERIMVVFNNVVSQPLWWTKDVTKIYLGTYSRTKYEALVTYTGVSDFGKLNSGQKRQCALKLKDAIEQYNLQDKDKDGNEFPMEVPIY